VPLKGSADELGLERLPELGSLARARHGHGHVYGETSNSGIARVPVHHWTVRGAFGSSNGSRASKPPYDKQLHKCRTEIECTFNLLKQARRFATRYEKTLRNYAAVVAIGCASLWLRV